MYRSLLIAIALFTVQCISAPTSTPYSPWQETCNDGNIRTRVDFADMPPQERKCFTDAIKCIMDQPSSLDQSKYPAAVNRYFDYAVTHVLRTGQVHLSGYFLTWHRYFLHLFEEDLRNTCGYEGRFPYWNFAKSVGQDLASTTIFNGDEYSMSGDGLFNNTGPIVLGPSLSIPHGTGGGCVTTGPFANLVIPLKFLDPALLINGSPLPADAFAYTPHCLTRDLNSYVVNTYTTPPQVTDTVHATDAADLELLLNGVIGGASLGIHSAGHFSIGGPMNSIHVSPQDPMWYPLHAMIDFVYTSWQINHPDRAKDLSGTMTANNAPPSANVTLDSIEPDWGIFDSSAIPVKDLLDTKSGPFCYQYDYVLS